MPLTIRFAAALGAALLLLIGSSTASSQQSVRTNDQTAIPVDMNAPTTPFPHFWERTFGSGRAVLSLRESYRKDLDTVHDATGLESIRFHGILNDEVGVYDPDRVVKNPGLAATTANATGVYNFSYVDQIYDGLLEHHVRPFVELSFTPKKMASDPASLHAFWYKPNVSPPKDYKLWDAMIEAFAQHLIARYGLEEVAMWKFEVWNEPNIDFWMGEPKQATYFELYDHTARALKHVSSRLQVGGPATAAAGWVAPFLAHVHAAHVPVDFVSTHVYGNDEGKNVLGTSEVISRDKMVWRAVEKVHGEVVHSAYPKLPLIFSEYGPSYANEPNISDSTYAGSWLANNIRLCAGLTDTMAYWDFSDVFEEQGVVRTPFYGGFGLIAADNIAKPVLNAFAALHRLGEQRIAVNSEAALATRTPQGLAVALWNYQPPDGEGDKYTPPPARPGPAKDFEITVTGMPGDAHGELLRVDEEHGNVIRTYDSMGRPATPTRAQLAQLRTAAAMAPAEPVQLTGGKLRVSVPAHGLAVLLMSR